MPIVQSVKLESFSAFHHLKLPELGSLNVIIGLNDTGKTQLLKVLYAVTRSIEDYHKKEAGPQPEKYSGILTQKLLWSFVPTPFELGKLVTKTQSRAEVKIRFENLGGVGFSFGKGVSQISAIDTNGLETKKQLRSTFIPAKEILTLFKAIEETREGKELGVFDDTYYDLVKEFRLETTKGNFQSDLKKALESLQNITGKGSVSYHKQELTYKKGKEEFSIHQAAEGIRKVAILDRLIRNRRLSSGSECILFLDEPEANLHPKAIVQFAELLHSLAKSGIQVFLATHSYFMIKRLEQFAKQDKNDFQLIDLRRHPETHQVECVIQALKDGLTDNPIIEQSLWLYQQDVEMVLGQ